VEIEDSNRISSKLANASLIAGTTQAAFLLACRMIHEEVVQNLREALLRLGLLPDTVTSSHGRIAIKDLPLVFWELGAVSADLDGAIEECVAACDLQGHAELSFGELYSVLWNFCVSDGFTNAETQDIARGFNRFLEERAHGKSENAMDELDVKDMAPILRSLGYLPSQYRLYNILESNDLESATSVDLDYFTKFIGTYRWDNLGVARRRFLSGDTSKSPGITLAEKRVPLSELGELLSLAGHSTLSEKIAGRIADGAGGIDSTVCYQQFLGLEAQYRRQLADELRDNFSFTPDEIAYHLARFRRQVLNKDAESLAQPYIVFPGFWKIVSEHFPEMKCDTKLRVLVEQSDENGNGKIEVDEYAWIMRRLIDDQEIESLAEARSLREKLRYSKSEIQQIREIFELVDDDASGDCDFTEVVAMFNRFMDLTSLEAQNELKKFWGEMDLNEDGRLDFWEFLRFMRHVQDKNWRNIKSILRGAY